MEKITLTKEDLYGLLSRKPDFDGSEGNLYKVGNRIYKLYHNPYVYSSGRLKQIISFQPKIKRTRLPLGALYFDSQFIGAILYLFENASSFETLYHSELDKRICKLKELSLSLQELTANGLVLEDLYYENLILAENKTVQIIDTDGNNIIRLKNNCQLQKMLNHFRGIILECCEPEITILKNYKKDIPFINSEHLNYDALDELLNYINSKQYQKVFK